MTLVVGYADQDIGFLVADSLLTPNMPHLMSKGPVAGEFHGLKIQIIGPNVAVAFSANDANTALDAIHTLKVKESDEEVPNQLFEKYRLSSGLADCEFLVLEIKPDRKTLAHVTNKGVMKCSRAYVGVQSSYADFKRRVQAFPIAKNGEEEFDQTADAMKSLVQRRRGDVGAIAGCVIRVVDARISKTLEYLQEVEAGILPWEGVTGYSLLASNSPTRGIGIYYRGGKFGFMLIVGDTEDVRKEAANTITEFIEIGNRKYGLHLEGGQWCD
jgi:hypothetical protein